MEELNWWVNQLFIHRKQPTSKKVFIKLYNATKNVLKLHFYLALSFI